ncbi:ABC transporter ATP-binding protein [Desulforudis sp. DRI-14]|uniref:ABC transporter ATP-binding protein n=1 Tax=Desulforudis sp. DRI-14 TaxID=3459793 RepID=UPI004041B8C9
MNKVIETDNLTKKYPAGVGCSEICLSVNEGQIFGFLGPNGAGKSTFVKILVGLLKPTSGAAQVLGRPLGDLSARRRIGFLPEQFRYQEWLTGEELLRFHASLCGLGRHAGRPAVARALEMVGLRGRERGKIRTYSKGMQQRIGMACAILADPDLVFLDEPTSALDPIGRREVREIILQLKQAGKTVFLNSHLLSEVEMVCDEVAVIKAGRIVAAGSLAQLLGGQIEVEIQAEGLTPELEAGLNGIAPLFRVEGNRLRVRLADREQILRMIALITAHGGRIYSLVPRQRSLEDLFVELIERREVSQGVDDRRHHL